MQPIATSSDPVQNGIKQQAPNCTSQNSISEHESMQYMREGEKRTFCIEVKPGSFMFDLSLTLNRK